MKLKLLPIALAALMLVGCNNSKEKDTSPVEPASESVAPSWKYLSFLTGENPVRFDIFNFGETGLQISYGNTALSSNINNATLNDNAKLSINKNLDATTSLNIVIVSEKENGNVYGVEVYKGISGDNLVSYFSETLGDDLKGYQRAYVAFSIGEVNWTKGLNSEMDAQIDARSKIN